MLKTTPMVCNIVFKVFALHEREQVFISSINLKINQIIKPCEKNS